MRKKYEKIPLSKRIQVRFDHKTSQALSSLAETHNLPISWFIRQALNKYLKEFEQKVSQIG